MCCLGRLCVKGILVPINGCYLVIGIISLISFGFLKFGVSLFLNALTNLIHEAPGGIGDNVKPSELASVLQPYFDLVAWPLFGVAVVFVALGAFGIAATCCPTCCRWFGWAYIGILGAALAGLIIFIVVWFLTASSRVSAIRANIKDQIRTDYVDFWQLNNQNLNVKALVLNFVHAHFECKSFAHYPIVVRTICSHGAGRVQFARTVLYLIIIANSYYEIDRNVQAVGSARRIRNRITWTPYNGSAITPFRATLI